MTRTFETRYAAANFTLLYDIQKKSSTTIYMHTQCTLCVFESMHYLFCLKLSAISNIMSTPGSANPGPLNLLLIVRQLNAAVGDTSCRRFETGEQMR